MEIEEYLEKMKSIQLNLLEFLDKTENNEENYQNLIKLFDDQKIRENRHEIKSLLILLLKISNNHHRSPNFFDKIEKIVLLFKKEIKQSLSNNELFLIFKNSKRFLYFLLKENIFELNDAYTENLSSKKCRGLHFLHFLYPYDKPFISKPMINKIERELPPDYENLKRIGENDNLICQLIRSDVEQEFISYMNEHKETDEMNSTVKDSFFETNNLLLENEPTLIEYAAFYGSFKIFRYLHSNNVKLTPSLWIYAIHGRNMEIIHYLVDNKIIPEDKSYEHCIEEAIKCHHNEIVEFIKENLVNQEFNVFFLDNNYNRNILAFAFHYYDYLYFANDINHKFSFYYLCQYDYYTLVELYLKTKKVYINMPYIFVTSLFLAAKNNNYEIVNLLLPLVQNRITEYLFKKCTKLTEITIPPSITIIGSYSFYGCSSLKKIVIPPTITYIGDFAFQGCCSLPQIDLPQSLAFIGKSSFNGCTSLLKITIPPLITVINDFTFYQCALLSQLTILSALKSIGKFAFSECTSIKQFSLPSSVSYIDESAFNGCSSLLNLKFDNYSTLTFIGNHLFDSCSSLIEATLPSSVKIISMHAFRECVSLKKVSIPSSVIIIDICAFCRCSSLSQIEIPSSVTKINGYAFSECNSLTSISIPSSIKSINEGVFSGCSSLKEVELPNSIKKIKMYAFAECFLLSKINFPPSLIMIGNEAFRRCESLNIIKIPSSVELGNHVFSEETIVIKQTV